MRITIDITENGNVEVRPDSVVAARPNPDIASELKACFDEIENLLTDGSKIRAVKFLRTLSGCRLIDAKDAIEMSTPEARLRQYRRLVATRLFDKIDIY